MAVANKLGTQRTADKAIEYKCGEEVVKLSPSIVRNYLVSGNGNVTDQEVGMFINLCRFQHLNPFLREAYLIKFGNKPATMVVGKDTFLKRARRNPDYAGFEAGVVIMHPDSRKLERRTGSMVLPGEVIVGGWAKVYIKGFEHPVENTVGYGEYEGKKSDGTTNGQWSSKPGTMIRKVALVQAFREAFPEDFGGLYDQAEMGVEGVSEMPIDIDAVDPPKAVEPPKRLDDYRQQKQQELPPDIEEEFMDNEPPLFEDIEPDGSEMHGLDGIF